MDYCAYKGRTYWLHCRQGERKFGGNAAPTHFTSAIDLSASRDPNQCGHLIVSALIHKARAQCTPLNYRSILSRNPIQTAEFKS